MVVSDDYLDFYPALKETLDLTHQAGMHRLAGELVDRASVYAAPCRGHDDDITVRAVRHRVDG